MLTQREKCWRIRFRILMNSWQPNWRRSSINPFEKLQFKEPRSDWIDSNVIELREPDPPVPPPLRDSPETPPTPKVIKLYNCRHTCSCCLMPQFSPVASGVPSSGIPSPKKHPKKQPRPKTERIERPRRLSTSTTIRRTVKTQSSRRYLNSRLQNDLKSSIAALGAE